jgi:tetratricopeptide (TPR) repeat protein
MKSACDCQQFRIQTTPLVSRLICITRVFYDFPMSTKKPNKRKPAAQPAPRPHTPPVGPVLRNPWEPEAADPYDEDLWDDEDGPDAPAAPVLPKDFDPYLSERFNRAVLRIVGQLGDRDIAEVNTILQRLTAGKKVDEVVAEARRLSWDDVEEAQFLMFDAMICEDEDEARALVDKALELDPANADANTFMAHGNEDIADIIAGLRRAVALAEEKMGPEYMEENRGHFWGVVQTRPYMRARHSLFQMLILSHVPDEAVQEGEALLSLNPNDNQGVRDWMYGLYLRRGNTRAVRALIKRYRNPNDTVQAYAHVVECIQSNNKRAARLALRKAARLNRYFLEYLLRTRPLPEGRPSRAYSPGSPEEAVYYVYRLYHAWMESPHALEWLAREICGD